MKITQDRKKQKIGPRIDKGIWKNFRKFIQQNKGRTHGEIGRTIEKALIEYLQEHQTIRQEARNEIQREIKNLQERIEDLEENLPKDNNTDSIGRTRPQRIDAAAKHIAGSPQIRPQHIEKAIESVGIGGDPRTIKKYTSDIVEHLLDNYNYVVVGKIPRDELSTLDSKERRILAHRDKKETVKQNLKKQTQKQ